MIGNNQYKIFIRKYYIEIFIILVLFPYILLNAKCSLIIKDNKLIGIRNGVFQKRDDLTEIVIPDSVLIITNEAFRGCTGLRSVDMADTVTRIESLAFKDSSLENIRLSASLKEIEGYTFSGSYLAAIEIPDQVTYIGMAAFKNCTFLKQVKLPQSLETIEDEAFESCKRLADLQIPERVTNVGKNAFDSTKILSSLQPDEYGSYYLDRILVKSEGDASDIIVKNGTIVIAAEVFSERENLETVTLPENLLGISEKAFYKCKNISNIEFPDKLEYIGSYAFTGIGISQIKLPENLLLLYDGAFWGCENLVEVELPRALSELGKNVFTNTPWFNSLKEDEYGCVYVDYIFLKLKKVTTELKIKPGTKLIANDAAAGHFMGNRIEFPEGVISIGNFSFFECPNMKEIILPKSLKTLGSFAFYNSSIKEIDLPEGLETIGHHAFSCSAKEIVVPESVMELYDYSFEGCRKLKILKVPKHLRGYFLHDKNVKIVYY